MTKQKGLAPNNSFSEILLYQTPTGKVKVEIYLKNENLWLTQERIAELFGVQRPAITKHLINIFNSHELQENQVSSKMELTTQHGALEGKTQTRLVKFYNLDAIISVGYRINSKQATQFRIWATERLKEYIIKGFTMDDERLKNPETIFGKDYFGEQLERIRDIRSSERRFYQKITDIYSQCSADYSSNAAETTQFFATVQNKLHWAISHQTAAEIISNRANSQIKNMGLTSWKNHPKGAIRKADVGVAKNYLSKLELEELNIIVSMYLDFAELQAKRGRLMRMQDWIEKLDSFITLNDRDILSNAGKVSAALAKELAETALEEFKASQDRLLESDFDQLIKSSIDKSKSN